MFKHYKYVLTSMHFNNNDLSLSHIIMGIVYLQIEIYRNDLTDGGWCVCVCKCEMQWYKIILHVDSKKKQVQEEWTKQFTNKLYKQKHSHSYMYTHTIIKWDGKSGKFNRYDIFMLSVMLCARIKHLFK